MTLVDDELLSGYLDGELDAQEALVVGQLLRSEPAWSQRLEAFRADSLALRELPEPQLAPGTREVVYRAVTESFALGAERRRVPRFKRRWMLLAAFAVPCLLTLLYLQNPNRGARLYLKGDELVLRAGRSGQKNGMTRLRSWKSPPLWGMFDEAQGPALISFQLDAGKAFAQSIQARVSYDFQGDGKPDRVEQYEAVSLDNGPGWERFHPPMLSAVGAFADFRGGRVTVELESKDLDEVPLELSGSPGELVLPYRQLGSQPPSRP